MEANLSSRLQERGVSVEISPDMATFGVATHIVQSHFVLCPFALCLEKHRLAIYTAFLNKHYGITTTFQTLLVTSSFLSN